MWCVVTNSTASKISHENHERLHAECPERTLMGASPIDYLRGLVSDIPVLNEKLNCRLQNWGDETPPATIAFGEIGDAIAENMALLPEELRRRIFATIEEGMISPDPALGTAVATGLVEALVSSADKKPELWNQLDKLFGAASRKHALAWRNFGR